MRAKNISTQPQSPVTSVLISLRHVWIAIAVLSLFVNILMLTGPLYMLQVYDRVLASQSLPTLITLSLLMLLMYCFMGAMDFLRTRLLARLGNYVETQLSLTTFKGWVKQGLLGESAAKIRPLQDLRLITQFLRGPAPTTFFDIPFTPIYLAVIFMLHPALGLFALFGAISVLIIAISAERLSRKPQSQAYAQSANADYISQHCHNSAETLMAMGMDDDLSKKWQANQQDSMNLGLKYSDITGGSTAFSKAFRMFLQSAILGLGAALAVKQIVTPGVMIAGSIILGRALAPIQMVISQWRNFIQARNAYQSLGQFFEQYPNPPMPLPLPAPEGRLAVQGVIAGPPNANAATVSGVEFSAEPGDAVVVLGPSGSGKSTLARLLVGAWMPQIGTIRLDGATYDQWDRGALGPYIGYLPQQITLFDGTIGENIARFRDDLPASEIVKAAQAAGVHEMILALPDGYNTLLGTGGTVLSTGQTQRIGLARALYGEPVLIVLDEPNSNLDTQGDQALNRAISNLRAENKTIIIITHRQSVISVANKAVTLAGGKQTGFGYTRDLARPKAIIGEQPIANLTDHKLAAQNSKAAKSDDITAKPHNNAQSSTAGSSAKDSPAQRDNNE